MRSLKAYLLVRRSEADWSVTVHHDLESLVAKWDGFANEEVSGVIHVGFDRPETHAFEASAKDWKGKILLTGAARYALPSSYSASPIPIGEASGIPLFVALSGWGYALSVEDTGLLDTISLNEAVRPSSFSDTNSSTTNDWLVSVAGSQLAAEARSHGIVDEITYLDSEARLPATLRRRLGEARYLHFVGNLPSVATVLSTLKYCPKWFLDMPLSSLSFSVRTHNCLRENSLQVVKDLTLFDEEALLKFDKFGRGSLLDLREHLVTGLQHGPSRGVDPVGSKVLSSQTAGFGSKFDSARLVNEKHPEAVESLEELFRSAFALLSEREEAVLRLRMGFDGPRKTLQEAGDLHNVTRERIRQLARNSVTCMRRLSAWQHDLAPRLDRLLSDRPDGLPLLGLGILDPWFDGAEAREEPLAFVFEHFLNDRFSLINVNQMVFVSKLNQDGWEKALRSARILIAAAVEREPLESEVRDITDSLLTGQGEELRFELWTEASREAHFMTHADSPYQTVLVGYGTSAEKVVEAILTASERPMHFEEIARRCFQQGRSFDIRRVHNAAANVGLLFGRGIYGLPSHFPLTDSERQLLVSEIEEYVESGDIDRQWHARELADAMGDRGLDFDGLMTPYIVSIALKSSILLADLGRMIWAVKSTNVRGARKRIDVHQAVVAMLLAEGRPMKATEIQARIGRERGLNCYFQIQVEGPLIKLGTGYWGLANRDLPFSEERSIEIMDQVVLALDQLQKGLHVSEIARVLSVDLQDLTMSLDHMLFIGIAQRDRRCAIGKGQFIYLREWGEPRRLTVFDSVRQGLLAAGTNGLTLDGVVRASSEYAERTVSRLSAGQCCSQLGAVYDDASMRWTLSNVVDVIDSLDTHQQAA